MFIKDFFNQTEDLSMVAPISHLIADILMDQLEIKIFKSNHVTLKHVIYWYRYVDDLFFAFGMAPQKVSTHFYYF